MCMGVFLIHVYVCFLFMYVCGFSVHLCLCDFCSCVYGCWCYFFTQKNQPVFYSQKCESSLPLIGVRFFLEAFIERKSALGLIFSLLTQCSFTGFVKLPKRPVNWCYTFVSNSLTYWSLKVHSFLRLRNKLNKTVHEENVENNSWTARIVLS